MLIPWHTFKYPPTVEDAEEPNKLDDPDPELPAVLAMDGDGGNDIGKVAVDADIQGQLAVDADAAARLSGDIGTRLSGDVNTRALLMLDPTQLNLVGDILARRGREISSGIARDAGDVAGRVGLGAAAGGGIGALLPAGGSSKDRVRNALLGMLLGGSAGLGSLAFRSVPSALGSDDEPPPATIDDFSEDTTAAKASGEVKGIPQDVLRETGLLMDMR